MKISEMNNDQATEAMARISVPLSILIEDKEFVGLIDDLKQADKGDPFKFVSSMIPKIATMCLKDHKAELYEIVGALTFKPSAKVGKMNFLATVKELRESIDEDFISFFKLSGSAIATPGEQ